MVREETGIVNTCLHDNAIQSASQARCNITFAEIASSLPADQMDNVVKVLTEMLRDVHCVEFDTCLSWSGKLSKSYIIFVILVQCDTTDWSLPDQLICETVVALLKICVEHPKFRQAVIVCILEFVTSVVRELTTGEGEIKIFAPSPLTIAWYSNHGDISDCSHFSRSLSSTYLYPLPMVSCRMETDFSKYSCIIHVRHSRTLQRIGDDSFKCCDPEFNQELLHKHVYGSICGHRTPPNRLFHDLLCR